jgi:hypothetical protein
MPKWASSLSNSRILGTCEDAGAPVKGPCGPIGEAGTLLRRAHHPRLGPSPSGNHPFCCMDDSMPCRSCSGDWHRVDY